MSRSYNLTQNNVRVYTEREHALELPGMYIDSMSTAPRLARVIKFTDAGIKVVTETVTTALGLLQLLTEPLANACDAIVDTLEAGWSIEPVSITMDRQTITISNVGCIPVEIHQQTGRWVPELLFTQMRTTTNESGRQEGGSRKRHGGGQYGMGVKLTVYYSKWAGIQIDDCIRKVTYKQQFFDGGQQIEQPSFSEYNGNVSRVTFSFQLDLTRFGYYDGLYTDEIYGLFGYLATIASFTCKTPIIFNDTTLNYSSIYDFVRLHTDINKNYICYYQWPDGASIKKDKLGVETCADPRVLPYLEMMVINTSGQGDEIAISNSLANYEGGIHIDAARSIISKTLSRLAKGEKKNKAKNNDTFKPPKLKEAYIRNDIFTVISVRVNMPDYAGQFKSKLRSFTYENGIEGKITIDIPDLSTKLSKWPIINCLKQAIRQEELKMVVKASKNKKHTFKGESCEYAGIYPELCRLVVFEGDSAMAYARCIKSAIPDGIRTIMLLPTGGKIRNALNTTSTLVLLNDPFYFEFIKMMGLNPLFTYTTEAEICTLKARTITIMTDADPDGQHIKLLVICFLEKFFPNLLSVIRIDDWRTNMAKGTNKQSGDKIKFYSKSELDQWKLFNNTDNWFLEYCKGLGTSSEDAAIEDANNPYIVSLIKDEYASESINVAMNSNKSYTTRKNDWLSSHKPDYVKRPIINNQQYITTFIQDEFVEFGLEVYARQFPSRDMLVRTRTKILYTGIVKWKWFTRLGKQYKERVDIFSSEAVKLTHYHNAELSEVVFKMCQSFVGSNNIRYFSTDGQFGTRAEYGNDHAASRYPYLYCNDEIGWFINKEDKAIFEYTEEEGEKCEPKSLYPCVPFIFNGCEGIGLGRRTFIPKFNPLDIISWFMCKLTGQSLVKLTPWYRNFTGTIEVTVKSHSDKDKSYTYDSSSYDPTLVHDTQSDLDQIDKRTVTGLMMIVTGRVHINNNTVYVTELPVGVSTVSFITKLEKRKSKGEIVSYVNRSDIYTINIEIVFPPKKDVDGNILPITVEDVKISKNYSLCSMNVLDDVGRPVLYKTFEDILEDYYTWRLPIYQKRKDAKLATMLTHINSLTSKIRCIEAITSEQIVNKDGKRMREEEELESECKRLRLDYSVFRKIKNYQTTPRSYSNLVAESNKYIAEYEKYQLIDTRQLWYDDLLSAWNNYISRYGDDRGECKNYVVPIMSKKRRPRRKNVTTKI